MQEMRVWPLGQEEPLEEGMATRSSILSRESCGQRSLMGWSPWGRKESDATDVTKHSAVLHTEHRLLSVRLVADTWLVSTRGCGERSFCEHRRAGSSLRPCFHLCFVPPFGQTAVHCVDTASCCGSVTGWAFGLFPLVAAVTSLWPLRALRGCVSLLLGIRLCGFFPRPAVVLWHQLGIPHIWSGSSTVFLDSVSPTGNRLRPQDCPCLHLKMPVTGPGCFLCLWPTGCRLQFLRLPSSLGLINFPEWRSELRETSYSLDDQFITKGVIRVEDTRGRVWRRGCSWRLQGHSCQRQSLPCSGGFVTWSIRSLATGDWPGLSGGWERRPSNCVTVP